MLDYLNSFENTISNAYSERSVKNADYYTKVIDTISTKYLGLKEIVTNEYAGTSLDIELEKLNKAFDIIGESKITKPLEEEMRFTLIDAKNNKLMTELTEKYSNKKIMDFHLVSLKN